MGVFTRGTKLWIAYKTASGRWHNASTGHSVGEESAAQAKYEAVLATVKAQQESTKDTIATSRSPSSLRAKPRQLPSGAWRIQWIDADGVRQSETLDTEIEATQRLDWLNSLQNKTEHFELTVVSDGKRRLIRALPANSIDVVVDIEIADSQFGIWLHRFDPDIRMSRVRHDGGCTCRSSNMACSLHAEAMF